MKIIKETVTRNKKGGWRSIIVIVMVGLVFVGCNKPKAIKDETLKEVFKEIFIANAYMQTIPSLRTDSLSMYQPILEKQGHTVEDLIYTIENFAKRKSAKLSDVVDMAIEELEKEEKFYQGRVAALDSVLSRSQRKLSRVIREDSTEIKVTSIKDTARLRVVIPVEYGIYKVSYDYTIDSLDQNKNIKTTLTLKNNKGKNSGVTTNWMTTKTKQSYKTEIKTKKEDEELVILFGNYPKEKLQKPNIVIEQFRIIYMPNAEIAVDSIYKMELKYKLLIDGKEYDKITQDSSTLYIHPPRISQGESDSTRRER